MSRIAFRLILAAVIGSVVTFSVFAQVTMTFAVIPEQALPAIPVDFRLTVSNGSSQPFTIRNGAALEITTQSGDKFFAASGGRQVFGAVQPRIDGKGSETLVIPAGSSVDFHHTADCQLLTQEYFYDWRLSIPGRYSLRMVVLPEGVYEIDSRALWSNAVTLTVKQPEGDDAAVWNMLTALSAKEGRTGFAADSWASHGPEIARDVYTKYPRSHYLPYVACWKSATNDGKLQDLAAALSLNPSEPIGDRLKLMAAAVHDAIGDEKRTSLDADGAIAEMNAARQLAQDVEAHSVYPFVRAEAAVVASHIMSDEGIRKNVADLTNDRRNSPYKQVIPFVECVSIQHDGGLTARFGYRNLKDQTETIEAGSANLIVPADAAKKVPTTFRAGVHKNAFHATSSGGPITWRLLTFAATASKDSPQCGGNN